MKPIKHLSDPFFSSNKTRYAFIDGMACKTIAQTYLRFEEQLSFPDYFSHNLDSLDEMLSDLDWIPQRRIRLIISDVDQLLCEDEDKKESILEIINEHENKRLEVYFIGSNQT